MGISTDSVFFEASAHRPPVASIFKKCRSTARRENATGIGRNFSQNNNSCTESQATGCHLGWKDVSFQLEIAAAVLE